MITGAGAVAAIGFASAQSGGIGQLQLADLLLFGAVVSAAIGYAEGGLLARELGSWQTVSWALVLASPLMVVMAAFSMASQPPSATPVQWAAFAYLGVVSMFFGFFAWYRGLAIGPMAQVSQIQLVQPVLEHLLGRAHTGRRLDLGDHHRRHRGHPLRRPGRPLPAGPPRAKGDGGGGGQRVPRPPRLPRPQPGARTSPPRPRPEAPQP